MKNVKYLPEGMGGRLKTRNGQLVPLKKRMNSHQFQVRAAKMQARRTVAELLFGRQEMLGRAFVAHVSAPFWKRVLWVIWPLWKRRQPRLPVVS